jgi:FMN-dependent NADH-azoreductase
MENILFVNSCVNLEKSRTNELANWYLSLQKGNINTIYLENLHLKALDTNTLNEREEMIKSKDFSSIIFEQAKLLKNADKLIIAAPYWDLSFPAMLKTYLEHICIKDLTFCYGPTGIPQGLTSIKEVVYITTSGGYIGDFDFGFEYIKKLFSCLFSVEQFSTFSAQGLDIYNSNVAQIMQEAKDKISKSIG